MSWLTQGLKAFKILSVKLLKIPLKLCYDTKTLTTHKSSLFWKWVKLERSLRGFSVDENGVRVFFNDNI